MRLGLCGVVVLACWWWVAVAAKGVDSLAVAAYVNVSLVWVCTHDSPRAHTRNYNITTHALRHHVHTTHTQYSRNM